MPVTAGPIYPGIKDGLVFAIDPANKDSWTGPTSTIVNNLPTYNSNVSGSIFNDTSGSYGQYNSFNFDGTDSYINVTSLTASIQQNTIGTISLWAKAESNSSYDTLFSGTRTSQYRTSFSLRLRDSGLPAKLMFTFRKNGEDPSHVAFQTTNTEISADTWYNIAVTQDGTAAVCYINGSTVSLENLTSGNTTTVATLWYQYIAPQELYIGKNRVGNQNNPGAVDVGHWDGQIGPILFYNRALSAGEVLQNYNRLKERLNNIFTIDYLVVAGGASGGGGRLNGNASGGGGAGGVRTSFGSTSGGGASSESSTSTDIGISFTVTVGAGGAINEAGSAGNDGNNSVFSTITSLGGGGGGGAISDQAGRDGGSGGGGGSTGGNPGSGTANQGFDGGDHGTSANYRGGGGGGASEAGESGTASGNGGDGLNLSSILGTSVGDSGVFGGGGSGGVFHIFANPGSGGTGGGGTGGDGGTGATPDTNATAGTANTGGGGGGAPSPSGGGTTPFPSGAGGSGVVILRYPSTRTISIGAGLTSSTSTSGDFKITVFTAGTDTISFS